MSKQTDGNDVGIPLVEKDRWPLHMHMAWADDFTEQIGVHMILRCPSGLETYGESPMQRIVSFNLEPINPLMVTFNPPVTMITRESAQRVINELWTMGFRPQKYEAPGQLAAQEAHIKDLQAIVGTLLTAWTERERAMIMAGSMMRSQDENNP